MGVQLSFPLLANPGNCCFINTALQVLWMSPPTIQDLVNADLDGDCPVAHKDALIGLQRFVASTLVGSASVGVYRDITRVLGSLHGTGLLFARGYVPFPPLSPRSIQLQQDSTECLEGLLDVLSPFPSYTVCVLLELCLTITVVFTDTSWV